MSWDTQSFNELVRSGAIDRTKYKKCPSCGEWFFVRVVNRHIKACRKVKGKERKAMEKAYIDAFREKARNKAREPRVSGIDATQVTDYMLIGSAPKCGANLGKICDIVVLAAEEYQPSRTCFKTVGVVKAPLDDTVPMRPEDMQTASMASDFLADQVLKKGRIILSTCAMGVNRSSLIAALTMLKVDDGLSVTEIIELIRATRGVSLAIQGVNIIPLSNTAFVKFLKRESLRYR